MDTLENLLRSLHRYLFKEMKDDFIIIKETKQNKVEAKRISVDDEIFLYCKSNLKRQKEQSMQSRLEQNFQEQLSHLS